MYVYTYILCTIILLLYKYEKNLIRRHLSEIRYISTIYIYIPEAADVILYGAYNILLAYYKTYIMPASRLIFL